MGHYTSTGNDTMEQSKPKRKAAKLVEQIYFEKSDTHGVMTKPKRGEVFDPVTWTWQKKLNRAKVWKVNLKREWENWRGNAFFSFQCGHPCTQCVPRHIQAECKEAFYAGWRRRGLHKEGK